MIFMYLLLLLANRPGDSPAQQSDPIWLIGVLPGHGPSGKTWNMAGLKQMVRHPVRKKRLDGWDWIIKCVASSTDLKVWSAATRVDGKSSAYSEIDLPQFPHSRRPGYGYN